MENSPNCATCSIEMSKRLCKTPKGKSFAGCPTRNKAALTQKAIEEYKKPDICHFARQASIQEGEGYADKGLGYARLRPAKPRIAEIMEFAEKMGYRKLGMVFCIGLRKEARAVAELFSSKNFSIISVICKVGCMLKKEIGVTDDQQLEPGSDEALCNPILQAMVLNDEKTEFNVLLGLCVGHDSLFFKYAQAPCTVLAVKDRLLGHNPLAAVYTIDSYYRSLK